MKKISIIRAELAKDINANAKIVAAVANSQPQYVNMIRRRIKAELTSQPTKIKRRALKQQIDYAKGMADNVGIASLNPFDQIVPEQKSNLRDSELAKYYAIIVAIVAVTAVMLYVSTR
jgi:hypothetical protein